MISETPSVTTPDLAATPPALPAARAARARLGAGRRRHGLLLSVVRDAGCGRGVPALAAARQCAAVLDRVQLLAGPRHLLELEPRRPRRADARDPRRRDRDDRRLVVGAGLAGGPAAPGRHARRAGAAPERRRPPGALRW